jgi:hypothetical protein
MGGGGGELGEEEEEEEVGGGDGRGMDLSKVRGEEVETFDVAKTVRRLALEDEDGEDGEESESESESESLPSSAPMPSSSSSSSSLSSPMRVALRWCPWRLRVLLVPTTTVLPMTHMDVTAVLVEILWVAMTDTLS